MCACSWPSDECARREVTMSKAFDLNSAGPLLRVSRFKMSLLSVVLLLGNSIAQVSGQLSAQTSPVPDPSQSAPLTLTLQDALKRAHNNTPQFQAAVTQLGVAKQEKTLGRAGLLPSVNYPPQYLYTQGNSLYARGNVTPLGFRFIANNAVHEYVSQGHVHEVLSLDNLAAYRRASAGVALAKANAEIAERGLTVTVGQAYYGLLVAERKYATAQQAAAESQRFADISQKLEHGG